PLCCWPYATTRSQPSPPLSPYTTLFRSHAPHDERLKHALRADGCRELREARLVDALARLIAPRPEGVHGHLQHVQRTVAARIQQDRKSTRLNSSHVKISYAVFCLKKKNR